MIFKLLLCVPAIINIAVFWFNRQRSADDLKNVFIAFQLVLAVVLFFTSGFLAVLGKLFFVLLVKILAPGFVKGCWILSCILDVFSILSIVGG